MERALQVGVKILIKDKDDRYLLIRRSEENPNLKDMWDIPGGRIIPGSGLMENLAREVMEETGLKLVGDPKLIDAQDIFFDNIHVVRLTFLGDAEGEVVLDKKEHSTHIWVSLNEMKRIVGLDTYLKQLIERRGL